HHLVVAGTGLDALLKKPLETLPRDAEPFKPLLTLKGFTLVADFDAGKLTDLVLSYPGEEEARKALAALDTAIKQVKEKFKGREQDSPAEARQILAVLDGISTKQVGDSVRVTVKGGAGAIALGLLMPAVQKVRQAAARTQAQN